LLYFLSDIDGPVGMCVSVVFCRFGKVTDLFFSDKRKNLEFLHLHKKTRSGDA